MSATVQEAGSALSTSSCALASRTERNSSRGVVRRCCCSPSCRPRTLRFAAAAISRAVIGSAALASTNSMARASALAEQHRGRGPRLAARDDRKPSRPPALRACLPARARCRPAWRQPAPQAARRAGASSPRSPARRGGAPRSKRSARGLVRDGHAVDWVADDRRHLLTTAMSEYTQRRVAGRPSRASPGRGKGRARLPSRQLCRRP